MGNTLQCTTATNENNTEIDVDDGSASPKPSDNFLQKRPTIMSPESSIEYSSDYSPAKYTYPGQVLKDCSTLRSLKSNSGGGKTLGAGQATQSSAPGSSTQRAQRLQQLTQTAGQHGPRLNLRIINGNSAHKNQVLKINPKGLSGSQRVTEDGSVYFGTLKHSMPDLKGNICILNDYVLPPYQLPAINSADEDPQKSHKQSSGKCHRQNPELLFQREDRHRGQHVQIHFDPDSMYYKIKDLGIGLGAYRRIEHQGEPHVLCDNQIINVGSTLLLVSLMDSLDEETSPALMDRTNIAAQAMVARNNRIPLLKLKVVGGPSYGKFFVMNPLDSSKQHVLGRVDDCSIYINDQILSKRHCTFQFVQGSPSSAGCEGSLSQDQENRDEGVAGHWILKDGYMTKSMNSTWVYLSQDTVIKNKMIFKASEILFEANLLN